MESHAILEAGQRQPRRVVCLAHDGCAWHREVGGRAAANDPIVLALVRAHVAERVSPAPPMMGHPRRARL